MAPFTRNLSTFSAYASQSNTNTCMSSAPAARFGWRRTRRRRASGGCLRRQADADRDFFDAHEAHMAVHLPGVLAHAAANLGLAVCSKDEQHVATVLHQ